MERRHFLKVAFGFAAAAGAATLAASAQAAPLAPQPLVKNGLPAGNEQPHPAVTTADEVGRLKPEEIRWGRHWHRRWHWRRRHWRRHWGWRRHRHWGWRHRWHRRRYW